jgi:hypothetical protein
LSHLKTRKTQHEKRKTQHEKRNTKHEKRNTQHEKMRYILLLALCCYSIMLDAQKLPDTGISGVYEVMLGAKEASFSIRYFREYGFSVIDSARIGEEDAFRLYGVRSRLTSYRLQNDTIDSHGLLRLLIWEKPLGNGVGYTEPESIGTRMAVMMTADITRLYDVYSAMRANKQPWLPTEPIADDLFGLNKNKTPDLFNRPVLVRENAVYGDYFNHVFFQRNGYTIPGYGYINAKAPLKTSEFTHHDFFIKAESMEAVSYLSNALGLQAEKEPEIDGDWLPGPRRVFAMAPGYTHLYQGFVSPNNICGKLKFFIPRGAKPDRSAHQRIGEMGITLHSFYTPKLDMVYDLVKKDSRLKATTIQKNEFGERSFVFSDTAGISWQIIEKTTTKHKPVTKLEFKQTND